MLISDKDNDVLMITTPSEFYVWIRYLRYYSINSLDSRMASRYHILIGQNKEISKTG